MARSKELKKKLHSPPTICPRCGESHYVGFEHICIEAYTAWEKVGTGSVPTTHFTLTFDHPIRSKTDLNWVQAFRVLKDLGQGSTKQCFEMLNTAKDKTDVGPTI